MALPPSILSDSASPARLKKTNSPFLSRRSQIFDASRTLNPSTEALTGDSSGAGGGIGSTENLSVPSKTVSQLIHSFSQTLDQNLPVPQALLESSPSTNRLSHGESSVTISLFAQMDSARPTFDDSPTGEHASAFDSPSSDSAESTSPISTLSADSWGERTAVAAAPSSVQNANTVITSDGFPVITTVVEEEGSETSLAATAQMNQGLLVVPGQGEGELAPSLDLPPNSPFSPGALLQSAMDRGTQRDNSDSDSIKPHQMLEVPSSGVEVIKSELSATEKSAVQTIEKAVEPLKDEKRQSMMIDYERLFEEADARPKDDEDEEGEDSEVEQDDEENHSENRTVIALGPAPTTATALVDITLPIDNKAAYECGSDLLVRSRSDLHGAVQTIANNDASIAATVTAALTDGTGTTSAQQLANQWRRDQSTSLLIQRPDGSTIEHIVPHETFAGSQFLDKRQKRKGSLGRLGSIGSLASSSKNLTQAEVVASSSSGRLDPALAEAEVASASQASMSEDDTPPQDVSDVSTESSIVPLATTEPKDLTKVTVSLSSSSSSSSSTTASTGLEAVKSGESPTNKKPSKINTAPLAPGKKWVGASSSKTPTVEKGGQTTKLNLGSPSSSGLEPVILSRVSRKGKLFAQKIKTIANFEYNTSKKLGKGNFGIVYQGNRTAASSTTSSKNNHASLSTEPAEEAQVAIKKITRKLPGEIEKLGLVQREMKVCRLFKETIGIVPLLAIITTSKHHYLIFEKADGDLAEMIKDRCNHSGKGARDPSMQPPSPSCSLGSILNIEEIRGIMRTVVLGVQALHKEGYSHKDIKPANILHYRQEGLLCDFGLCSRGDDLPRNQFFGTQDYAAPEARRVNSHRSCDYIRSDIYSLGAVLYELATGQVLSRVISGGLNWQKMAQFGGRAFSELLQGMLNDIEKRWDIERVVNSRFWTVDFNAVATPSTPTVKTQDPAGVASPMTHVPRKSFVRMK